MRRKSVCESVARSAAISIAVERVHAHDHALGIEVGLDQRAACGALRCGGDGVLEIEDDAIGPLQRLGVPLRAIGGAEQQRRTEGERGHDRLPPVVAASAHHIRAMRDAVATTTPSWLRPVWAIVTSPCPGREAERRFAAISVSQ